MKKIFFGACMLMTALIGVAATKASTNVQPYYIWNTTLPLEERCQLINEFTPCVPEEGVPCTYAATTHQLYEKKVGIACDTPLVIPE